MMKFETYKFLELSEDWYMLLEQNNLNNHLARFFSLSVSFETFNFGIYHTKNITGFNKIGGSNDPDWKVISFEDFIKIKKGIGIEQTKSIIYLICQKVKIMTVMKESTI